MLQEIGFLVLFLPATQLLPDLRATALPLPTVAFMLRWFVLRSMFGFVLFVISLFYLLNNSWFTRSWLSWPADLFPIPHSWMPPPSAAGKSKPIDGVLAIGVELEVRVELLA